MADEKQDQAKQDDAQAKANQAAQERAGKAAEDEKPYEVTYPIPDAEPDPQFLGEQGENDDEQTRAARDKQAKDADKK